MVSQKRRAIIKAQNKELAIARNKFRKEQKQLHTKINNIEKRADATYKRILKKYDNKLEKIKK